MFNFSVLLLLLAAACSVHCDVESRAYVQNDIHNSNLDLVIELLEREKNNIPKIPADDISKPLDCADVFQMGNDQSDIYEIWPVNRLTDGKSIKVYCDMDTDGGGWTVIQRRGDFSRRTKFYQNWNNYKNGFGDKGKDFWLGNENIFALTNQNLYSVRFDLKAVQQNEMYALYQQFWIDDEDHKYTLHISNYSGDAGDSMTYHNNQAFTTKDKDNDRSEDSNCAVLHKGGWWYSNCLDANLNGLYGENVVWNAFTDPYVSLEATEIKIRPKNFRPSLA